MFDELNNETTLSLSGIFQHKSNDFSASGNRKDYTVSAKMFRSLVAMLAVVSFMATGSVAFAAKLLFKAELSGAGEVPPVNSNGKGHLDATLDTDTNTLTWTVSYSGLSGAVTGAHFHGPVSYIGNTSEQNAAIQVGTAGNLASPFKGSTTITATQAKDLKDGRWYFNIHTPANPAGEIRGQIVRN